MEEWKKDAKKVIAKYLNHPKDFSKIIQITELLKPLGIDSCFYNIHHNKRRLLTIGNNIDWLNYYKDNVIYHNTYHAKHINYSANFFFFFLDMLPHGKATFDMAQFKMPSALIMGYNTECGKYTESFVFTSMEKSETAYKKFIEHLEYLKNYCIYFKDKAYDIIKNNRIINQNLNNGVNAIDSGHDKLFGTKRYFLSYPFENIYLTKKELIIMKEIIYGNKIKEIAKKHYISFRTVEKHIENIKIKVGAHNTNKLFKVLIDTNLINCIN